MSEKEINLSDIILSGFFVFGVICGMIFISERLGVIPVIRLRDPNLIYNSQLAKDILTPFEKIIIFLFEFECFWIFGMFLYWKIRKYKVIW